MEWMCNIPVGKTHLKVEFTGGVLTQYGNTPAKFTTDDKLKQAIIENSKPYKDGKITLIACVDSQEEETRRVEGTKKQVIDETQTTSDEQPANEVEVASLDDAKEYLNKNHGVAVRNLRSRQAIIDAAKQCGVSFKGI